MINMLNFKMIYLTILFLSCHISGRQYKYDPVCMFRLRHIKWNISRTRSLFDSCYLHSSNSAVAHTKAPATPGLQRWGYVRDCLQFAHSLTHTLHAILLHPVNSLTRYAGQPVQHITHSRHQLKHSHTLTHVRIRMHATHAYMYMDVCFGYTMCASN